MRQLINSWWERIQYSVSGAISAKMVIKYIRKQPEGSVWKMSQCLRELAALLEGQDLNHRTQVAAHSHMKLQYQGPCSLLWTLWTLDKKGPQTFTQTKHFYIHIYVIKIKVKRHFLNFVSRKAEKTVLRNKPISNLAPCTLPIILHGFLPWFHSVMECDVEE